ncbi:flagellar motor protein [Paenibacillus mucilaginosus]|uniref:MotA n=1 Tax=Paenibacillus mucilaginosus (strain KNP414) TaxID=1036673 RepID=F8FJ77_PAEMK|nr:flagellar motor protein [Paenibacillus mucilaginosus]AEI38790.1 MotA [Paenibacillus mucilaginosus KNP414]MCG7215924.1 flagellar motor protein [Paenibacillus mucilaginosus]WDM27870.1 flagellar motor protein [Paenibacillus mucilaginosus]
MDLTTIIGILAGLAALVGGYLWDGGDLSSLFVPSALLIVIGGTLGAVAVSFPWSYLKGTLGALRMAFRIPLADPRRHIDEMMEMASVARREGVLSLEQRAQQHPDPFLREGLTLVVDGTDPSLTKQILELEMDALEQQYESRARVLESAGGYAPTMGIIGTVMGLIHVLGNLSEPGNLAPAIAVAFTATLYGVATANLIYLPLANKIKVRGQEVIAEKELLLEGILALQAGENPYLIKKKMMTFLVKDQSGRTEEVEDDGTPA